MDFQTLQADPAAFRNAVLIDADAGPVRLGEVLDDWQRENFHAIDGGLLRVVTRQGDAKLRAWIERPRGHSKTSDIAIAASWLLFASRAKLSGVVAAADSDQAGLLIAAIDSLLRVNPWLSNILQVRKDRVFNKHTGSELVVISSDAASSYGTLPDFVICDEVSHWQRRDLWDSLFSAAAKRRHCLLMVIGNAGWQDSWVWPLREAIREDESWLFRRLEGPCASWITPEQLAEQRRLLPDPVYRRLWLNEWIDGTDSPALTVADIDSAITMKRPPTARQNGWLTVAGLDIGLTRDASALVLVRKHVGWSEQKIIKPEKLPRVWSAMADLELIDGPQSQSEWITHAATGRVELVYVKVWEPTQGRVELNEIEAEILKLHQRFGISRLAADPWQAMQLIENCQRAGIVSEPLHFTPANLQSMAQAVLEGFRERTFTMYPHGILSADLKRLRVEERASGYRLAASRTNTGEGTRHADAATALSLALVAAKQIQGEFTLTQNRHLVFS